MDLALEKKKELLALARQAAQNSYSPYSQYQVGAALLCTDGTIVIGCNVENKSGGITICAERTALVKAISDGRRDFRAMAVVCLRNCGWPCGICRQFINEVAPGIEIIEEDESGQVVSEPISALLPAL